MTQYAIVYVSDALIPYADKIESYVWDQLKIWPLLANRPGADSFLGIYDIALFFGRLDAKLFDVYRSTNISTRFFDIDSFLVRELDTVNVDLYYKPRVPINQILVSIEVKKED